mgnify:FL=1
MTDDNDPIVGHKTFRDADGYRHEPLRQSEAGAIMNRIEAAQAKREADMPTEQDAILAMFSAWQRLKELGWREGRRMPTTGERFATVQTGSTGIHACTAERRNTFDVIYTTDDGDLWPSSSPPTLFRPWRETDVQQDNGICAPLPDDAALRTLSRLSDEMGEEL